MLPQLLANKRLQGARTGFCVTSFIKNCKVLLDAAESAQSMLFRLLLLPHSFNFSILLADKFLFRHSFYSTLTRSQHAHIQFTSTSCASLSPFLAAFTTCLLLVCHTLSCCRHHSKPAASWRTGWMWECIAYICMSTGWVKHRLCCMFTVQTCFGMKILLCISQERINPDTSRSNFSESINSTIFMPSLQMK